jgi:hypothetical protein
MPRTIIDYSFFGVNHEPLALSPEECVQFGCALLYIPWHIRSANPHIGPVYLSNIDITDGFYCMWVRAADIPKLDIIFPSKDGE